MNQAEGKILRWYEGNEENGGRMIDSEDLKESVSRCKVANWRFFLKLIDSVPHYNGSKVSEKGVWFKNGSVKSQKWACSKCGKEAYFYGGTKNTCEYAYCPHCGSPMEGSDENNTA